MYIYIYTYIFCTLNLTVTCENALKIAQNDAKLRENIR